MFAPEREKLFARCCHRLGRQKSARDSVVCMRRVKVKKMAEKEKSREGRARYARGIDNSSTRGDDDNYARKKKSYRYFPPEVSRGRKGMDFI